MCVFEFPSIRVEDIVAQKVLIFLGVRAIMKSSQMEDNDMSRVMKKILIVAMALCLCMIPLTSCSGSISADEGKLLIDEFFAALAAEDYQKAQSLLHPEYATDLQAFLLQVEENQGLRYQDGVKIQSYIGYAANANYNLFGGGQTNTLTLTADATVGEKKAVLIVEIVRNEAGYGISNFTADNSVSLQ